VTPIHRAVSLVVLWGAATAFGLAFATWTAVGPVVLVFTRRHGVHVGDLVALGAAYTAAAVLSRRLLRNRSISNGR
jgi:nitrate/nitrite transporter NarK